MPHGLQPTAKLGDNGSPLTHHTRTSMKGHFAAIVLIGIGTFFLLSNLGLLHVSLAELIKTWWPAILIALGISMLFTPGSRK
jgi:Domain of unknown function (DUF5668)